MKRLLLAAAIALAAPLAYAQSTWDTPQTATGGPRVGGGVGLCLNSSNQAVPCNGNTPTVVTPSTNVATYRPAFDVTGYTTPTDLWQLCGSATKTVKVRYIRLSGTATTATSSDIILVKRSTADTGGTPTSITLTSSDSQNAASGASLVTFAAAPTLGTLVGAFDDQQLTMPPPTSSTPAVTYLPFEFGARGEQPVVLRGVAECIALNFQGAALPAGMKISNTVVYTEE